MEADKLVGDQLGCLVLSHIPRTAKNHPTVEASQTWNYLSLEWIPGAKQAFRTQKTYTKVLLGNLVWPCIKSETEGWKDTSHKSDFFLHL